ncbi:hypothetical protein Tco_0994319 [Tanacetum coccineum]
MENDPTCPLLVGRGFLATISVIIDCKKSKIAVGEEITRSVFRVKEVDKGMADVPYSTTHERQKFYGPRPNTNIIERWFEEKLDWNKPPKEGVGVWHIKIELIDPDEEKFDRIFQSMATTRKLSKKDMPIDILDLDHFHVS